MRTKLILTLTALLTACGPLVIGGPEPDPMDLGNPDPHLRGGPRIGPGGLQRGHFGRREPSQDLEGAYNLTIRSIPAALRSRIFLCGLPNRTVIRMSADQRYESEPDSITVWGPSLRPLWGRIPYLARMLRFYPSRCRDADRLQTFTEADQAEICRHAQGQFCQGYLTR